MLTASSVAHHNTRKSCWVIINSQVYDLTEFLDHHPGGSSVILQYAGKVQQSFYLMNINYDAHKKQIGRNKSLRPGASSRDH